LLKVVYRHFVRQRGPPRRLLKVRPRTAVLSLSSTRPPRPPLASVFRVLLVWGRQTDPTAPKHGRTDPPVCVFADGTTRGQTDPPRTERERPNKQRAHRTQWYVCGTDRVSQGPGGAYFFQPRKARRTRTDRPTVRRVGDLRSVW